MGTLEEVDVSVVEISFDAGVTFESQRGVGVRAPAQPGAPRQALEVPSCVGRGDVSILPGNIEHSYEAIERYLAPLVDVGVSPLLLGGDHSISLAHLRAVQLAHRCKGTSTTVIATCTAHGMRRAIEEERADVDHSIDVSDPALAAPGTGRPQTAGRLSAHNPAGRLSAHNLETLRRLSGIDFVGCDAVQAISGYDPAGVTATPAASVGYEAVSLAALRRPGCEREAS